MNFGTLEADLSRHALSKQSAWIEAHPGALLVYDPAAQTKG
jgi:hypothetical protein